MSEYCKDPPMSRHDKVFRGHDWGGGIGLSFPNRHLSCAEMTDAQLAAVREFWENCVGGYHQCQDEIWIRAGLMVLKVEQERRASG